MATKAKAQWQKQESRLVRPFRTAQDCLAGVSFRLHADDDFSLDDAIRVSDVQVSRLAPAVLVSLKALDFEKVVGVPVDTLRLVVTVEDRTFKDSGVAVNLPMSDLGTGVSVLDLDADVVARLSWAGETRVHVAVILGEARNSYKVGTAHRVGAWVARKTFFIGKTRDIAAFSVNAVEPEYFKQLGLPPETSYLVEIADPDLNQPSEHLSDLVKVSLAKVLHSALARDEESSMAKALIKSIYVDIVTTVLATGYSNLTADVQPDSIIQVVTSKLARSTGLSAERIQQLAKDNAGAPLRAVVQADVDLTRALVSATQRRAL